MIVMILKLIDSKIYGTEKKNKDLAAEFHFTHKKIPER